MTNGEYRYTVAFEAGEIIEERLLRLLETVFCARDVSVGRESLRRPPRSVRFYPDEVAVIEILSDRRAHRRKMMLERLGWQGPPARFYRVVQGLIDIDVVRKVRQGVYALADAPPDLAIPEARNAVARKRQLQVLDWLAKPLSAPEIRERLGVTRQRVDQILKRLERDGHITKRSTHGEASTYVWVRVDRPAAAVFRQRPPRLTASKGRLLSSLRADRLVLLDDLANCLAKGHGVTLKAAKDLERHGLLIAFRLGAKTYVTITALGIGHPQYHLSSSAPPNANILQEFGVARTAFLQALQVLGPQRTLDLTYAVPPTVLEGPRSSGQYIQALQAEGLIEQISSLPGKASQHCLTPKGVVAAQLIALACPPPSLASLQAAHTARWTERRKRQSEAALARQGPQCLSQTQSSVVETLRTHGPLTISEIFDRMGLPPKNRGSLWLMMHVLQERQLVRRVSRTVSPRRAYQWQVASDV